MLEKLDYVILLLNEYDSELLFIVYKCFIAAENQPHCYWYFGSLICTRFINI